MINLEQKTASNLMSALKTNDEKQIEQAWQEFHNSVVQTCLEDYKETTDTNVLAQRGIRQLTSKEVNFYEKMIASAKSSNPKQAFTDLITTEGGMPETVIEDVFKDLVREHPLLARVKFQNVKYLTKWLLNDHTEDMAVWGEINAEITKQIESGFKAINIQQGKLSAYLILPKDMLDLGHAFLDNYVRTILKEVIALGLEYGIVKGKGVKGEPIGLVRDIHKGVSINEETGYPLKAKVELKDFTPKNYGALIGANLVKKENGKIRKVGTLQLICNPVDYVTKIMPSTTVLNGNAEYKRDVFPMPTEVIQTTALEEGEAILTVLDEYFLGIGGSKDGVIEYSDEFKFLEDVRTYKTKMFAFGRCEDNTSAVYLNIANLEPTYIMVKDVVETA